MSKARINVYDQDTIAYLEALGIQGQLLDRVRVIAQESADLHALLENGSTQWGIQYKPGKDLPVFTATTEAAADHVVKSTNDPDYVKVRRVQTRWEEVS